MQSKYIFILFFVCSACVIIALGIRATLRPFFTDTPASEISVVTPTSTSVMQNSAVQGVFEEANQRIFDTSELYSLEIPATWSVMYEQPVDPQVSSVLIVSPDFESDDENEENLEMHSYLPQKGASIHIVVQEGEDSSEAGSDASSQVRIDGIDAQYLRVEDAALRDVHMLTIHHQRYTITVHITAATESQYSGEEVFRTVVDSFDIRNDNLEVGRELFREEPPNE